MVRDQTLATALEDAWEEWRDRPALVDGDRVVTYEAVGRATSELAHVYRALGVQHGDRVVCALPTCPEVLIAAAAAWLCGAIHVAADAQLTTREVDELLGRTGAVAHLSQRSMDEERGVRASRERTIRIEPCGRLTTGAGTRMLALTDLIGEGAARAPRRPSPVDGIPAPEDPALILPTSGTTGTPKLPVGYHGPLLAGWRWLASELQLGPEDVHLGHLPLSHGFGLSTAVMALMTGGCVVLLPSFSAEPALDLVSRHRVTVLHGTPTHFILLTDRCDKRRHDVGSLRIGVGTAARFPPLLLRRIFDELGMDLLLMYGSSEGVSVVTTNRQEMLAGCVGRPDDGWVAVIGDSGDQLPPGEVGEITFRRDMWPVTYWNDNGAGAESPWYRTGDIGRLDAEGRLYVLGRRKHQIDRGGIKVDPGEVEDRLVQCPGVLDAAVVAAPNPVLGEVVCACVVAEPGAAVTLEGLRRHLAHDLASFKLPEELVILPSLPRTPSGKLDRDELRERAAASPRESVRAR